ncbi:hypothetical protein CONCODRAFT_9005 [Conidiobolus coronatus NRRL 28638]|uniref:Uncharacterized protein n=1 Tax=Conidiobolus coronatus (strain ATCC 28846 / CBS 209.66 / NRRL 28638) TaxID=796925 RepID=A0A137P1C7_CONC2|nr:hypothetical protein CONCODRAFT_9005 [Conidiobolus coronatus NRRL 28638]|eukprot:KXN68679.1 hypothetical protein CONCODRAFT_9005 [Conidiobolus coronatus NRRL 28638]
MAWNSTNSRILEKTGVGIAVVDNSLKLIEGITKLIKDNEEESYPESNEIPQSKPTATKNDSSGSEEMSYHEVAASLLEAYFAPIVPMYNNQPEYQTAQSPQKIMPKQTQHYQMAHPTMVKEDRDSLPTPDKLYGGSSGTATTSCSSPPLNSFMLNTSHSTTH